jgi:hypothetical protein
MKSGKDSKIEEIKRITLELIKNGYGSDMIGMDPESLVILALKHAKHIYKSKEILDRIPEHQFLN